VELELEEDDEELSEPADELLSELVLLDAVLLSEEDELELESEDEELEDELSEEDEPEVLVPL
jgi:hypothetical protein